MEGPACSNLKDYGLLVKLLGLECNCIYIVELFAINCGRDSYEIWGLDALVGFKSKEPLVIPMLALRYSVIIKQHS